MFKNLLSAAIVATVAIVATIWYRDGVPYLSRWRGSKSVAERIAETQGKFDSDLVPALRAAGIVDLPSFVTLVFLKDSKTLDLYAGASEGHLKFVKRYTVKAASGKSGPKLSEGDKQVPEGIYGIESLNPNSNFYLSLRVGYPNPDDLLQAKSEKRENLGGDIMIHGSRVSIGCIAVGDESIAEIFHLAAVTDLHKWKILLAPNDLRVKEAPQEITQKLPWMAAVYARLKTEMLKCPAAT